jgi:hypothetical protein
VTGDKKQIEMARELIKEVMSQVCFDLILFSRKKKLQLNCVMVLYLF